MIDISIVVVSFNTKDFLKECLVAVYKNSKDLNIEVIVVDNNSKDGSAEMVASDFKDAILIKNKENLGFSKANNVGIKKTTGRYVLFLNSDAVVKENTLQEMVKFMDNEKEVGAATCEVLLVNGEIDDASHRGFPTPWNALTHFTSLEKILGKTKLFGGYNLGYMDLKEIHEIDALAGAFMIVRRKAGEEANWWDEDYFFYGEDLDFCYTLKEKGWKIYYVPTVSILHYKGVSGGIKKISQGVSTADETTKIKATSERFKAMRIFYKKHYENHYPKLVTKLVYLGITLKQRMS